MRNDFGTALGALTLLVMLMWPLLMAASVAFTLWILVTITVSIRGIRRELARLNETIDRRGLSFAARPDSAGEHEPAASAPLNAFTRTGPLNIR